LGLMTVKDRRAGRKKGGEVKKRKKCRARAGHVLGTARMRPSPRAHLHPPSKRRGGILANREPSITKKHDISTVGWPRGVQT